MSRFTSFHNCALEIPNGTMFCQEECCCSLVERIYPDNRICQNRKMSLLELCKNVLVNNFESYVLASTFKRITDKQSDFIKLASDVFFAMLAKSGKKLTLREACYMINHHLTILCLSCVDSKDIDAVLDKLTTAESLQLMCLVSPRELSFQQVMRLINALPSTLSSLSLRKCSAVIMEGMVQKFPNLKKLDLSHCSDVTDECIEILARGGGYGKNMVLQILNVEGTRVSRRGCTFALNNIPNLLILSSENLVDAIFSEAASGPYNLRALSGVLFFDVHRMFPAPHMFNLKRLCPYLTTLVVEGVVSEFELSVCALLGTLEDVTVVCERRCNVSLFLAVAGPNLTKLSIDGKEVTLSMVWLLKYCSKLKFLHLMHVTVEDIQSLTYSSQIMGSLVEIYLKDVSFKLNTAAINLKPNSIMPGQLFFKRSCFANFEDLVDKIISCTCRSSLLEHGVDYPHVLPRLAQILHKAAPNIERIFIGDYFRLPHEWRCFYCNIPSQIQ